MNNEKLILGIDAAWTPQGSSGVALLRMTSRRRSIVGYAPSYNSFLRLAEGQPVDWSTTDHAPPQIFDILAAATRLGGKPVDVIAIDMPIAPTQISGRRCADNEISKAFGSYGAAVHSPSKARPGAFGYRIVTELIDAGFKIATASRVEPELPALLEVYPLAAVTRLLRMPKRPLYKAQKLSRYMPGTDLAARIAHLHAIWHEITRALEQDGLETNWTMPEIPARPVMSRMKAFEDALDAILCAWVGLCYLLRSATAYGDSTGAIWVPAR